MTRKDYILLAETLAALDIRRSVKLRVVDAIADELAASYSNFQRHLFIKVAMNMTEVDQ